MEYRGCILTVIKFLLKIWTLFFFFGTSQNLGLILKYIIDLFTIDMLGNLMKNSRRVIKTGRNIIERVNIDLIPIFWVKYLFSSYIWKHTSIRPCWIILHSYSFFFFLFISFCNIALAKILLGISIKGKLIIYQINIKRNIKIYTKFILLIYN